MYPRVLSFFVRNQLMTILLLLHDKTHLKQKEREQTYYNLFPFLLICAHIIVVWQIPIDYWWNKLCT